MTKYTIKRLPKIHLRVANRSQSSGMTEGQFYSEYTGIFLSLLIILSRLVIYHNLHKQLTIDAVLGFLKFFPVNNVAIVNIVLNLYFGICLYP